MSTKGAVNVEYGVERVRHLDRIAAKMGMSRNDLLRKAADEVIAADAEDRPSFSGRAEELSPADVRHLVEENRTLNTELRRSQDQFVRREKKLLEDREALAVRIAKLEADGAAATEAAGVAVESRLAARLEQFEQSIAGGVEDFGNTLVGALTDAPRLRNMDAKLDEVRAASAEPRTQHSWQFGDSQLSVGGMIGAMFALGVPGTFAVLALTKLVGPLGVWIGAAMLGGGDTAVCNSIRSEYSTSRQCAVKVVGRTVTATAAMPPPAR